MSCFAPLDLLPEDPILNLNVEFAEDKRLNKVNLGVGSYKTAEGKPLVLSSVKKAEQILLENELNKEYLPIDGFKEFIQNALQLVYGKDSARLTSGDICGVQAIGGTGALRLGGDLLSQISKRIYFSDPTWPNHKGIFSRTLLKIDFYPYYDQVNHLVDVAGMCEKIRKMEPNDVVLMHGCCHNPTGMGPTFEEWKKISEAIKASQAIPFFDLAYQGFDQGLDEDAKAVRYFAEQGHAMVVASSYSKNFGLYNERVGLLSVVTNNNDEAKRVRTHLKSIIRGSFSNPPAHGALVINTILQSDSLRKEWMMELAGMRDRVNEMHKALLLKLISKGVNKDFSFLNRQAGLFSFSGLNQDQVHRLRQEYAIYMTSNGRINVAGLNPQNLDYVVDAIVNVL